MSESINKIKVKDITYDVEDSVARAGLDKVLLFESITWAGLKSLKDSGNLAPGTKYRITDYVTTTTQSETKSAGNQFDIIVEALTENTLNELASACLHEGDTYFSSQGCNLEAWQLWYDIENDTEKYEWADTENGKGVIYRMIDEKRNDCPYDFKNILFYNNKYTSNTTPDNYYYTFSYVLSGVLYDGTVKSDVKDCYGNVMKPYLSSGIQSLNKNIFRNIFAASQCYSNSFGSSCCSNSFGSSCHSNSFGSSCYYNSFGSNCYSNKFGRNCYSNKFGNDCYYNSFGNGSSSNSFGNNCNNNSFGNDCDYNTFGNNCSYRVVNYSKTSMTLNEEFYDDGSGSLVPIKHPDLSTQPSILPYKFMGQYVYEQLIPTSNILIYEGDAYLPTSLIDGDFMLDCCVIGTYGAAHIYLKKWIPDRGWLLFHDSIGGVGFKNFNYIKIVYTSMPEEGDYYGYNNY